MRAVCMCRHDLDRPTTLLTCNTDDSRLLTRLRNVDGHDVPAF